MIKHPWRTFYLLLANTLLSSVTNTFVWFTLTFWVFIETRSVLATSYVAGIFAVTNMVSAFYFGGLVDHHRKKQVMLFSTAVSFFFYAIGALIFFTVDPVHFTNTNSLPLWGLIISLMLGSVTGNLRMIAISTTVSLLFTENRDKANGLVGTVNGASFAATSILSGVAIGFFGMHVAIIAALIATFVTLLHLLTVSLPEPKIIHTEETPKKLDVKGTIAIVSGISGLFALIFFTTFNNFLGGVFMSLMDAYGLSLMPVAAWGLMLSLMSFGLILGGTLIAKFGLGKNPLKRMLMVNVITWTTCIFFTIQPSIILLGIGMLIWMVLMPVIESGEHTVIQKVVPYERQGRVFGFAQSVESAATPITTFLIGPIAQFIFIPFMTTGAGVALIGDWFGVGPARGIALVFMAAGLIGLIITLFAFRSQAYKTLSEQFKNPPVSVS